MCWILWLIWRKRGTPKPWGGRPWADGGMLPGEGGAGLWVMG